MCDVFFLVRGGGPLGMLQIDDPLSELHPHACTETVGHLAPTEAIGTVQMQDQLDRILASPSFRNSKRHTQFLQFLVAKCLAGEGGEIKERLIGIEVFSRPANYDLTADPIVRGAAVELRKRLATYYAEPEHGSELRLDLHLGSYVPSFHWPASLNKGEQEAHEQLLAPHQNPVDDHPEEVASALAIPSASLHKQVRWSRVALVSTIAMALLVAAGFVLHRSEAQLDAAALRAFWSPMFSENGNILVCAGDLNHLMKEPLVENDTWEHLTKTQNHLDANAGAALLQLGTVLGANGKGAELRLADSIQLSDLRQQPVIFVGGHNNKWTQHVLAGMRFQLRLAPNSSFGWIADLKNPQQQGWGMDFGGPVNSITRDYSLVTRFDDPLIGQPVVLLSGLGSYGNSAASEFVSTPAYFAQFARSAPANWKKRPIQIVLETTVVDGRVSVPRVVAQQIY